MHTKEKKTGVLYFDGNCSVCSGTVKKLSSSIEEKKFTVKNFQTNILPVGMSKEEFQKEIIFIDAMGKKHKNIAAIIQMLKIQGISEKIIAILSFPGIFHMLQIGYKWFAQHRYLIGANIQKLWLLKIAIILAFLSGIFLSIKLWVGTRIFPTVPIVSFFPHISPPLQSSLFVVLMLCLILALFFPKPKKFLWASIGVVAIFICFDQMRLQPWVYQYSFLLLILALYSWNHKHTEETKKTVVVAQLSVASIYIFSGLQKFNEGFRTETVPWLLEVFPTIIQQFSLEISIAIPIIETSIGFFLLTNTWKKFGVVLAGIMAITNLFILGPLGHNWNSVVWPWNIAQFFFVYILFWDSEYSSLKSKFYPQNKIHFLILIFFYVLPICGFFNVWDSYLSMALYSKNITSSKLIIFDEQANEETIFLSYYSFTELNVPIYPEKRIYKAIAKSICYNLPQNKTIQLTIQEKKPLLRTQRQLQYTCKEL